VQHIVVVLRWRRAAIEDPIEEIRIGTVEQCFEAVELAEIEAWQAAVGKRPEEQVALLCSAMPTLEEKPVAVDVRWEIDIHGCAELVAFGVFPFGVD
jgi:hypothetical protein